MLSSLPQGRRRERLLSCRRKASERAPRRGRRGEGRAERRLELDQTKKESKSKRERVDRACAPFRSAAASHWPWIRTLFPRGHARETTGSSVGGSWRREGDAGAQKRPKLGLICRGAEAFVGVVRHRAIDDDVMMVSLGPDAWLCTASLIDSLPRTGSRELPRSNAGGFGEKQERRAAVKGPESSSRRAAAAEPAGARPTAAAERKKEKETHGSWPARSRPSPWGRATGPSCPRPGRTPPGGAGA